MVHELLNSLLAIVRQGSESGWWGLACPAHCRGPGLGSLTAAFLLGVLVTLVCGFAWLYPRGTPLISEAQPLQSRSVSGNRRLAAYAHAPG